MLRHRPAPAAGPFREEGELAEAGSLSSGYVEAARLRLHHTFGGRGAPVLFVHGLGSAGYLEWRFNLDALASRHRVFAPDLPGFGRSAKPRLRYGVPLFAEVVGGYARRLRLGRPVLVGASLGGRVALEVALRDPGRVSALVLVNSLGLGRPRLRPYYPLLAVPRLGEAALRLTRSGLRRLPPDLIRRLAGRSIGASGDLERALDDRYLSGLRELHDTPGYHDAYLATLRSLALPASVGEGGDLVARLAQAGVPVLLVWGADDPLFPLEQARSAHRRLPGSALAVIAGAGHTPQAEKPDEFNRILERFLDG